MALHLKAGDGDLQLITEQALLTRCARSHSIYRPALKKRSFWLFISQFWLFSCNCEFTFCNYFILRIAWYKLTILSYKVWILRYKVRIAWYKLTILSYKVWILRYKVRIAGYITIARYFPCKCEFALTNLRIVRYTDSTVTLKGKKTVLRIANFYLAIVCYKVRIMR